VIISNRASFGGLSIQGTATVDRCKILYNIGSGTAGGGITMISSQGAIIRNSLIARNSGGWGGGIYIQFTPLSTMENCTVIENTCSGLSVSGSGGLSAYNNSFMNVQNSIIMNNKALNAST
jgi:hypothetical protein